MKNNLIFYNRDWIRTNDFRIMSPTSYHCLTLLKKCKIFLKKEGFEPSKIFLLDLQSNAFNHSAIFSNI